MQRFEANGLGSEIKQPMSRRERLIDRGVGVVLRIGAAGLAIGASLLLRQAFQRQYEALFGRRGVEWSSYPQEDYMPTVGDDIATAVRDWLQGR